MNALPRLPRLYLGTHKPHWLERLTIPLFVSRRRLAERKSLPRARGPWALDSGGFTEITMHGRWLTTAEEYAAQVGRWSQEVGGLEWAAIQDWMCEPHMLRKTGLSIAEHQLRTTRSLLTLRALRPDLPWAPVLQGWERRDYLEHVEQYERAGIDLTKERIVGVGSVCRRQATAPAEVLVRELARAGVKVHGFGFKATGVRRVWDALASSDSMAWSFDARRSSPLHGCPHKSCANCERYALRWYERQCRQVEAAAAQLDLLRAAA